MSKTRAQVMMDDLPIYYNGSRIVNNLMEREGDALEQLYNDILDVRNQLFIDTATWGLDVWERMCGIPTNHDQTYELRRGVIKTKIRGVGIVNVDTIRAVASSFSQGQAVDVVEDPSIFGFRVIFVESLGVPEYFTAVQRAIEEIKPAHLVVVYEWQYLKISEISGMTISELQTKKLGLFEPVVTPLPTEEV